MSDAPKGSRIHELVHGVNVTFHPVGDIPLSSAPGAGTANKQARDHIHAILKDCQHRPFYKPERLAQARELLRQLDEFERSGAVVQMPALQPVNPEFRTRR
jgi:hypothetical protein